MKDKRMLHARKSSQIARSMVSVSVLALTMSALVEHGALAAALPTAPTTFDTTYVAPTGKTIQVAAGGDLQGALNSAQLGDTIVLQAGATYVGPFTLPAKTSGSGWIYIMSSNYSSLPAPGKRVSPTDAVNMPIIVTPSATSVVSTVANSNHYRFVGIDFTPKAGVFLYNLITIGNSDTSPSTLPSNIVFDRCYVHGDLTANDVRGIEIDGAYVAVIDSYVSDFMNTGQDTQALWAYNTTGPLKIVDNYLESAGENVMFGGEDSRASTLVPSDIEISNNYFFKPLSWVGTSLDVKNLLEFKATKRALVYGNTFVNNPDQSQPGFAFLITPRNQSGNSPWSITSDIALTNNTFINVGDGVNILGTDDEHQSLETQRVLVRNNVLGVTGLNGADGRAFQVVGGGTDITIDHNTVINTGGGNSALLMADNAPTTTTNFVFTNNLSNQTMYGVLGSGFGMGTGALNGEFTNWTFVDNAIVGATSSQYPGNNFFPATVAAVHFNSYTGGAYNGGDVSLAAGSPYKGAGTDGLDLGANLTTTSAIPNPPAGLTVH